MARTKASVGAKVSSGKSNKARCSVAPPATSSGGSGGVDRSRSSGGNSVCPRETPKWQRAITTFFVTGDKHNDDTHDEAGGSSKQKHKRNIIESDDEEVPKNSELEESICLEPLIGEDSHKIDEYYPKNGDKGKGVGKKSKGKENVEKNNKRDREESLEEKNKKRDREESLEERNNKRDKDSLEERNNKRDREDSLEERNNKRDREESLEESVSKKVKI